MNGLLVARVKNKFNQNSETNVDTMVFSVIGDRMKSWNEKWSQIQFVFTPELWVLCRYLAWPPPYWYCVLDWGRKQ